MIRAGHICWGSGKDFRNAMTTVLALGTKDSHGSQMQNTFTLSQGFPGPHPIVVLIQNPKSHQLKHSKFQQLSHLSLYK